MKALVHNWWPAFTIVQGLTKYDANASTSINITDTLVIRYYKQKVNFADISSFCHIGAELLLQDYKTSFEFKTMSHSTEIGTLLNSKFVYKTSSLNSWLNIFKRIKPHGGESFEVKGLWSSLKNQTKLNEKVMIKSVVNNREY